MNLHEEYRLLTVQRWIDQEKLHSWTSATWLLVAVALTIVVKVVL